MATTTARTTSGKTVRRAKPAVEVGSGNVFADLGRADAEERQLEVQMAMRVVALLEAAGMTQAQTAERLGIAQPHVSELMNYKLKRFSVDRLIHFATRPRCRDRDPAARAASRQRHGVGGKLIQG